MKVEEAKQMKHEICQFDKLKSIINEGRKEAKFRKNKIAVMDTDADFISFDDEDAPVKKRSSQDQEMSQEDGEWNANNDNVMHDAEERKMLDAHKHCLQKVLYEIPPWIKKDPKFCLQAIQTREDTDILHEKYHEEVYHFMRWAEIHPISEEMQAR